MRYKIYTKLWTRPVAEFETESEARRYVEEQRLTWTNAEFRIAGGKEDIIYEPVSPTKKGLPKAIIVDMDGTLALLNGRNPYDASTCLDDVLNAPIAKIIKLYQSKVIVVSGRFEQYRELTALWLVKHRIKAYRLYMRKDDDKRKDTVVKKEIYETFIKPKYTVEFVLDDRDQVVKMWREEGLTCLQVAEGNF